MKEVSIIKASVEVSVLKIGNRQCTQAFIRQIPLVTNPIWVEDKFNKIQKDCAAIRKRDQVDVIGWINYDPKTDEGLKFRFRQHFRTEMPLVHTLITIKGVIKRTYIPDTFGYHNIRDNYDQLYISI